jgi:hypothetical protein
VAIFSFCPGTLLQAQTQLTGSLTNGLVAYYPLNGDFKDYSGNSNDLLASTNNITFVSDAMQITNNSYLYSQKLIGISENQDRTISLWIKPLDSGLQKGVLLSMGAGDISGSDYTLVYQSNVVPNIQLVFSAWSQGVNVTNTQNQWRNITYVYTQASGYKSHSINWLFL